LSALRRTASATRTNTRQAAPTEMDKTKARLIALIAVLGAAFVWAGYATFSQWAALVGGLFGAG